MLGQTRVCGFGGHICEFMSYMHVYVRVKNMKKMVPCERRTERVVLIERTERGTVVACVCVCEGQVG